MPAILSLLHTLVAKILKNATGRAGNNSGRPSASHITTATLGRRFQCADKERLHRTGVERD